MQKAEIESLYRKLAPKVTNYLVANGTPYAAACDDELVTGGGVSVSSDGDYLRKRIQGALDSLPPLLREAFTLFQVSELSVRDISLQLGITESLVKVRIFRAKQKLKTVLADLM